MAAGRRPIARACFATLSFRKGTAPRSFAEALKGSLTAGTGAERYGRAWRMARWEEKEGYIYGRIGFEKTRGQTELWNPKEKDFEEASVKEGHVAPFAVRLDNLRVAFQLRTGSIKPGTFVGAFQALLHEAAPQWQWVVTGDVLEDFEQWKAKVERITSLRITVLRPNPRYRHKQIGDIIEGARAKAFQIGLTADPGGGLDPEDSWVAAAIEQAEDKGKIAADGERREGQKLKKTFWRTSRKGAPRQTDVAANPDTGEATREGLRDELERDS